MKQFVTDVLATNDPEVLVVSHGFIMKLICQELLKAKFRGDKIRKARHGQLYEFISSEIG